MTNDTARLYSWISARLLTVWYPGNLYKIKHLLPLRYFQILRSYLYGRTYNTKFNSATSSPHPIQSGVPQGSILGPLLYTLYTSDLPLSKHTITSTFADDTAIVALDSDPTSVSGFLQEHLYRIALWLHKWKIQVNRSKSTHITFTKRNGCCPSVHMNQQPIPQHTSVKYLGLHLDSKLTWIDHIHSNGNNST